MFVMQMRGDAVSLQQGHGYLSSFVLVGPLRPQILYCSMWSPSTKIRTLKCWRVGVLFRMGTDASDYAIGAVLEQVLGDGWEARARGLLEPSLGGRPETDVDAR